MNKKQKPKRKPVKAKKSAPKPKIVVYPMPVLVVDN
jgi:hypothetical protein